MNKILNLRRPVLTALHRFESINSSTVDIEEVEKFKRLSSEWWKDAGEMSVLRNMNELRVPFIRDGLLNSNFNKNASEIKEKPLSGLKILDVGCGGGFLSEPLARLGANVTGIDATEELLNVAKYHKSLDDKIAQNINYVKTNIEDFVLSNSNSYDAVVTSEVIEHISNKKDFLRACVGTIKPGGSIFLTTLSPTLLTKVLSIYIAENILRKLPRGTHEFSKLISSHQLQRQLEEVGCITRKVHGMVLNPLTDKWFWVSSDVLHYALHAVKNKE